MLYGPTSGSAEDQRRIDAPKEQARRQRIERLLGGELRKHVRPASEMNFDYEIASVVARRSQRNSYWT